MNSLPPPLPPPVMFIAFSQRLQQQADTTGFQLQDFMQNIQSNGETIFTLIYTTKTN
jgi:hypothetical protein